MIAQEVMTYKASKQQSLQPIANTGANLRRRERLVYIDEKGSVYWFHPSMSAQDRETLAAAQARATQEADNTDSGVAGVAETAVHHRPIRDMEVDELERELSGMV